MRMPAAIVVGIVLTASPALAQPPKPTSYTLLDTIGESLFGDVYAEPSKWQPLSAGSFFSEGWNRPWVSPPAGGGGAPRQGWLNAFDGVFYRLGVATFGFADDFNDNGNQYTAGLTLYSPFSRAVRGEARRAVPSSRTGPGRTTTTARTSGIFRSRRASSSRRAGTSRQSFNVAFRIPTGSDDNGNGFAAVTPTWEFWWNTWSTLVLRGGAGFSLPYTDSDRTRNGVHREPRRAATTSRLTTSRRSAISSSTCPRNLKQPIDDRGPKDTLFTLTPGFRTHLGANWYLLGGVEVPVTNPKPFDFQVLGGLMKVF